MIYRPVTCYITRSLYPIKGMLLYISIGSTPIARWRSRTVALQQEDGAFLCGVCIFSPRLVGLTPTAKHAGRPLVTAAISPEG